MEMVLIIAYLLFIIIFESVSFAILGSFVSKADSDRYILWLKDDSLKWDYIGFDILSIYRNPPSSNFRFISFFPFHFIGPLSKYYIDGIGRVRRFSKLDKEISIRIKKLKDSKLH